MRLVAKKTHEVFGVSNEVLPDSYVDRGDLDAEVCKYLDRPTHIALRGASKSGKSWLRQTVLPDAITVQCRLKRTTLDIYIDALSQLEVKLIIEETGSRTLKGRVETSGDLGIKILAKLGVKAAIEAEGSRETKKQVVGHDVTDLRFVADIIKASGKRLVIEDFHYLSVAERTTFSFDLKTLWDYGVFVVIIGVWSEQNLIQYLNPDLSGRVLEVPIVWSEPDLREIFRNGGVALNILFSDEIQVEAISVCYENAGILQKLALGTLDECGHHRSAWRANRGRRRGCPGKRGNGLRRATQRALPAFREARHGRDPDEGQLHRHLRARYGCDPRCAR